MDTTRWEQVKEIFEEALDTPEASRRALIAERCGDDAELRREVDVLLAAHGDAGAFLSSPTLDGAGSAGNADAADLFAKLQRAVTSRYSLERELGRGGMGVVFLARDVALDRPVAIKLLPPNLALEAEHRARFLREARTAAGLSHPNIVPLHLVEEREGLVYFVMAFVDGESLGDRVRRAGPLRPAEAAKLMQEIAWALGYAHSRGVIHRDIKPDNILIDRGSGRALVTDFGIARVTSTATMSAQGEVLGTLRYMSPEQASADTVLDGRSDLYSLGVTAFFALTGRLPFDSANPTALIAMHLTEPAPPVRSVQSAVPARLAEAVDRCLAKDPAARFASGEALADAIADAQVTRREVAPTLREFLGAAKSGAAQLAALLVLWGGASEVGTRIATKKPGLIGEPLDPLEGLLAGLTFLVVARLSIAVRAVVRAGMDERDVAEAAAQLSGAHDANVEYEVARVRKLGERLSRIWMRAFFVTLNLVALAGFVLLLFALTGSPNPFAGVMVPVLAAVNALLLGLWLSPARTVATLTRGTPEHVELVRSFWGGTFARWLFKIAGIGIRKARAAPAVETDRTEVLLGRAAGELFEQLPKQARARLAEVPDVVRGLERVAESLRTRRDELARAIADVGAPDGSERQAKLLADLDAARSQVEARLGSAVDALQCLRLDLLRLRAGVGQADDLTTSIEQARAVSVAVEAELAARREVDLFAGSRAGGSSM